MSTAAERKAQYEGSALQALMEATDHEICPKCYCCDYVVEHEPCWACAGMGSFEDDWQFGEEICSECAGEGELSYKVCIGRCDENGEHSETGRLGASQ